MTSVGVIQRSDLLDSLSGNSSKGPRPSPSGKLLRGSVRFASAVLAHGRSSQMANLRVARIASKSGDATAALRHFSSAAAIDDGGKRGNWELAKFLLRDSDACDGDPQALRAQLVNALRSASTSTESQIQFHAALALAGVLYQAGAYAECTAAANLALSVSPAEQRALRVKANGLAALNRISDARSIYMQIVAREPESTEARTKLRALEALSAERDNTVPTGTDRAPLLIGLGGGIGDMLHATPMIRNIARRTASRVELVVLADHPGAEFLVGNRRYVSHVSRVSAELLQRPFEAVFLTHSFPLRFAFNAPRILASRDWQPFRAGERPETIFNLEAAKVLLAIPYEQTDAFEYFLGELDYRRPNNTLIGVHAGSKNGRWLSKRWPHFAELTGRLRGLGIRVASFGKPEEYVEGTEDRTGGSIAEMCAAMLDCTHFVSNDSGAMHIASALKIPTLALFAPTDPLTRLPLRETTIGLRLLKPCSPCEVKDHRYFATGACQCVAEIGVDVVERKLMEMIRADRGGAPELQLRSPMSLADV